MTASLRAAALRQRAAAKHQLATADQHPVAVAQRVGSRQRHPIHPRTRLGAGIAQVERAAVLHNLGMQV